MRVIIAGSRGFNSIDHMSTFMKCLTITSDTVVISGTARGADQLGEKWANLNGYSVERYPAEWSKYGRSAGYKRNELMATKADTLVAFWDGKSRGTKHMIDLARKHGLTVHISHY